MIRSENDIHSRRVIQEHSCCTCEKIFVLTKTQRDRLARGLRVFCSKYCQNRAPNIRATHASAEDMISPPVLLGAFAHRTVDGWCRCGKDATHFAAALYRGEVAVIRVCPAHAERARQS